MYNYPHGCAENSEKEYLASNQVVGGSNPSGRAIFSTTYSALKNSILLLKPDSPIGF